MFKIGNLKSKSTKNKKRVGRGDRKAGRGNKGQLSRSGGSRTPGFEGGQTPLYRRVPKMNRFKNYPFKVDYEVINIAALNRFEGQDVVGLEDYRKAGLAKRKRPIKILGMGDLKVKFKEVYAHKFTQTAKEKIEAASGKAIIL